MNTPPSPLETLQSLAVKTSPGWHDTNPSRFLASPSSFCTSRTSVQYQAELEDSLSTFSRNSSFATARQQAILILNGLVLLLNGLASARHQKPGSVSFTVLTLNTSHLTISPLHFSPSKNEASFPIYNAATAHLNCARKKKLKITFDSDQTQIPMSSFLLSLLLCVIQATCACRFTLRT